MKKIKSFFKVDKRKTTRLWQLVASVSLYAVTYVLYNGGAEQSTQLLSAMTFLVATEYAYKLIED